jgi:hypothetical protein
MKERGFNKIINENTLYDYLLQIDRDAEEMFSAKDGYSRLKGPYKHCKQNIFIIE